MKKLFFLSLVFFICSCSAVRNIDTSGFSIEGNTVLLNGSPTAQLEGVEYALDNRKLVKELTFSLMENADMSKITNMIAFLHKKHPDYEIEVEVDIKKIGGL